MLVEKSMESQFTQETQLTTGFNWDECNDAARVTETRAYEDHGDIWFSAPGPRLDNLCHPCPRVRRERDP